jgi:23S rRNA pseudouridine955/2504/2580 synthase
MHVEAAPATGNVQVLEVGTEAAGQRLDNYLIARLKGAPRSLVYRIIRGGEVRVNGGRVRPDRRLEAGDRVRVPPLRTSQGTPAIPSRRVIDGLAARIVYEDDGLLVIDKPSGLAVHGGSGVSCGLIEALRALRADCAHLELVHRLDRDTSGCVMVAKKRSMLRHLHEALREGRIRKSYLTLVRGRWPRRRVSVRAALEKNVMSSGERVVRAEDTGKAAETRFAVRQYYRDATLLEAVPLTGRTHQIRVHAQLSGHPIAGDPKYGDREFNRLMRDSGLQRLFLHAAALDLPLPMGQTLRVEAELDGPLTDLLGRLPR